MDCGAIAISVLLIAKAKIEKTLIAVYFHRGDIPINSTTYPHKKLTAVFLLELGEFEQRLVRYVRLSRADLVGSFLSTAVIPRRKWTSVSSLGRVIA